MRLALYTGMEECTKVTIQYAVHIEVVRIGVWNPQTPSSWTQFERARSVGPVELGPHSMIPHLGCSGKATHSVDWKGQPARPCTR